MISGHSLQLVLGRDSWLLMDRGGGAADTSLGETYPAPNANNVKAEKVYVIKQNTERGTGRGRGSKYNKRSIFMFLILVRSFLEIRQQNIIQINY